MTGLSQENAEPLPASRNVASEGSLFARARVWPVALTLVLVAVLALAVRWPTTQRGFFHWDEAQYVFAVQPGVLKLRETLGVQAWPRLFAERPPFNKEPVPYFAFSAKPGYDMLVMLYGTVAGLTPDSIGVLSLFFGLGTVLVLYFLASEVFDARVALAAGTILSVSTYHAFYSGSQSPVAMGTFFLLFGTYLYLHTFDDPSLPRLAMAGLVLAYAYGCHYNLLPYVLVIFGIHAARALVVPHAGGIRGLAVMGLSFLSLIGIFELFYGLLLPFAYAHLPGGRGAYLAQLWNMMGYFRWVTPSGFERFPALLSDSEGVAVLALALFGWGFSLRRGLQDWKVAVLLMLPAAHFLSAVYAGFSGSPVFSRMIIAILPFIALWGGVGMARLVDMARVRLRVRFAGSVALAAGIALVLMIGLPRAWAVVHLKGGYEESARYVLAHGGQQVTLGLPVEQYDLGSFRGTYPLPTSLEALRVLHQETGVRLLVLDHRVHILEEWGHPLGPMVREFERSHQPMAVISNPLAATLLIAAENAMSRDALARTLADPRSAEIRIYDLDDFLGGR